MKNKGKSPAILLSEKQFWEYAFAWHKVYVDMTSSSPSKIPLRSCQTCRYQYLERKSLTSHSEKTNSQHRSFGLVVLKNKWSNETFPHLSAQSFFFTTSSYPSPACVDSCPALPTTYQFVTRWNFPRKYSLPNIMFPKSHCSTFT